MLRYALLKDLGDDVRIVQVRNANGDFENLEINEEMFIKRLKSRVREQALDKLTRFKRKLTLEEFEDCLENAVPALLNDEVKTHSVREKK